MLNERQLQEIEDLQHLCEKTDHLSLKLNGDMLKMDTRPPDRDHFYYENGQLVGFAALYSFGSQYEVCGMVHPEFRRRGIFTRLWEEALASIDLAPTTTILLNAPQASVSARAWLKTIRCRYEFSEHEMAWHADTADEMPQAAGQSVSVSYRPYEPGDRDMILELCSDGFDTSEEDTQAMLDEESRSVNRVRSMVVYKGRAVGTFVMDYDTPAQAWVFGFVIERSFHGQGLGRSILAQIIRRENESGRRPYIGVETQNENALHLYESCGFRSYAVQDYYDFGL
ncbi:GNAT family N-acetyltransferase [Saccharibacillus qingshengii]|uniref:GNAT family N-acetyltransferase n=1 Tax=Saccharibacillus qingshengii TaxID=1763540 RepID=UPI0015557345|nr:GNAT family N-acetyltransferase [Saccharibacillus qingshengii]